MNTDSTQTSYTSPLLNANNGNDLNGFPTAPSSAQISSDMARASYLQAEKLDPNAEEPKADVRQIAFTKYFSYLKGSDKVLLVCGTTAAILAGAILPSISLVMGNVAVAFTGNNGG